MKEKYTTEEKMKGLDLYGLPCRIPTPTKEQAKCSHTEVIWDNEEFEDWDGKIYTEERKQTVSTFEDIPGTNNLRCTKCGYTRRY